MERTQVLVVGGSLVGLSTALFLRHHQAEVVLVERHHGTSIHPRTPGYNARTIEYFRAAGVADAVRAAGPWQLDGSGILWAESLASDTYRWLQPPNAHGPNADHADVSPCEDAVLSQDKLEPVLREHAERAGVDLRFGVELLSFDADDDGVTVHVKHRDTGTPATIRADYLVAADGADSGTRTSLGIDRHGIGVLDNVASVMVRADLGEIVRDKSFAIGQIDNAEFHGMVRVVGELLSLYVSFDPANGESVDQFTPDRCVALARAAAGVPGLDVEVLDVQAWQPTALVADRFGRGRVFLAGDAAHVMPPAGAYGANTGIQDAANLAWKLAYVVRGHAGPPLLDTYESERRPVADRTVEQAVATGREWFGADTPDSGVELVDELVLKFGYAYAGEPFDDPRHPAVRTGTRVPHAWIDQDTSTVDGWANGLVVFGSAAWVDAAKHSGLAAHVVALPGMSTDGAVLVRPDGFVSWRVDEASAGDASEVLRDAVARTLHI